MSQEFQQLGDIFKVRQEAKTKKPLIKPPAHEWQDLALQIIKELHIPNFKRNSVFKICKDNSKQRVLMALNDTKELCHNEQSWKYFFKIINNQGKPMPASDYYKITENK